MLVPPFPVANRIWPDPSDTRPPPDIQIPAPLAPGAESAVHIVVNLPASETPAIQPVHGVSSQWAPNAAYTTPFMSSRPGRWSS